MSAGTNRIITPLIAAFVLLTSIPTFAGRIIYVDDDGPADFNNIQAAIDDSSDGDIIIVADGTYTGEGNRDIDFLGKAITLRSENGPGNCIIDCNGSITDRHRGFHFLNGEDRNSIVDGLTIINGYAPLPKNVGGGIYCRHNPTIKNCIIRGNTAGDGEWGQGGGIYCFGGSPIISNCIITGNSAPRRYGGGICLWSSNPIIVNCIINNNWKGGIHCFGSNSKVPIIENCLISHNLGRGIVSTSNSTIRHCTIVGNSSYGIECEQNSISTVTNCIIWDNVSYEIIVHLGANSTVAISYSDVQGGQKGIGVDYESKLIWGQGNIAAKPCFVDPDNGDYHLSKDSPCVDAGTNTWPKLVSTRDLGGNVRHIDGDDNGTITVDMGPYEYGISEKSVIAVYPTEIRFITPTDGSSPPLQSLYLANIGNYTLNWQLIEECSWLQASPINGSSTGEFDKVSLTVDPVGLSQQFYTCDLVVSDDEASNSPVIVPVTLFFHVEGERHVPDEYTTIQAAIDDADPGDIVIVSDGRYSGPGNRDVYIHHKSITIRSENGPENCIIDCNGSEATPHRGFYFYYSNYHYQNEHPEYPDLILDGFTIINGYANVGSGIYCRESSPIITNCIFKNNTAWGGGGMYNEGGNPKLTFCTFSGNLANWGGGMSNSESCPTLTNCTFSGNSVYFAGGGMENQYSSPTLINCAISGNWAAFGGGFYSRGSDLTMTNCTFVGNYSTIGRSLICDSWLDESSNVHASSCILRNGGNEIFNNDNSTITTTYSNVQGGWPGEGNIDADPCFVQLGYWEPGPPPESPHPPQPPHSPESPPSTPPNNGYYTWVDGDYHLLPSSPCINAGDPNYVYEPNETDLDGRPRILGGRIDMGTYEYSPAIMASVRIVPRTINLASKGKWISCYIWLPEDYNVVDIEPNSIFFERKIEPQQLFFNEEEHVVIAKFSLEQLQGILNIGLFKLSIFGWLKDRTVFEGIDVIRIIYEGGAKLAKLSGKASNPNPADGAINVGIDADLSWIPGFNAASHDVYCGTNNPPPFVCNQTATTFDPGTIAPRTRYYWRIDEVNKWGTTAGDLWSFTTYGPPLPPPPLPPPPPPPLP